ncbi:MAG: hypothetical protein AB7G93_10045 [Bdellovibrionales bacterium]
MEPKKTTVWKVRIPPEREITLRDGTVIRNTEKSSAHLRIEMKITSPQPSENYHDKSKVS